MSADNSKSNFVSQSEFLDRQRLANAAPELLAAAEAAYTLLADFRFSWPGRTQNQLLLINLRDAIAAATNRDPREVQDDYGTRAAKAGK